MCRRAPRIQTPPDDEAAEAEKEAGARRRLAQLVESFLYTEDVGVQPYATIPRPNQETRRPMMRLGSRSRKGRFRPDNLYFVRLTMTLSQS